MTSESIYLAQRLVSSDSFLELIDELSKEEIGKLGADMRVAVRADDHHAAAMIEGKIAAFEELKRILKGHANKCEIESLEATP